jgi:hypothetical protein
VQELVDTGAIPPEEAADHPIAHMLTRSLGPTDAVDVEIRHLPDPPCDADRFLLCSDGLYNLVSDEEIAQHVSSKQPEEAARILVDLALERGGTDNITVEVLEVCDLSDSSFDSDYPSDENLQLLLSEPSVIENLQDMLEVVMAEELPAAQSTADESAVADSTEDTKEKDVEVSSAGTAEPSLEISAGPTPPINGDDIEFDEDRFQTISHHGAGDERHFLQKGAAFIAVLALFAVSYVFLTRANPQLNLAALIPRASTDGSVKPDSGRDELSEELAMWAQEEESEPVDASGRAADRLANVETSLTAIEPPNPGGLSEASDMRPEEKGRHSVETGVDKPLEQTVSDAELASMLAKIKPAANPAAVDAFIEQARDLNVGPAPDIKIKNEVILSVPANQPIVWENEALKVARVREGNEIIPESVTLEPSVEPEQAVLRTSAIDAPKVISHDETAETIERKQHIRDRIADLDVKLRLLSYNTEADIRAQANTLRKDQEQADALLLETRARMENAQERLPRWLEFKRRSAKEEAIKLADDVADFSETLHDKRERFSEASKSYLQAVDAWQANPSDLAAASKMGALGREMQKRRLELEEGVVISIAQGIETTISDISRLDLAARKLEDQGRQLSRHIGYHDGYTPLGSERKRDLRRSYLDDRKTLLAELEQLRARVSDDEEIARWAKESAARLGLPDLSQ